MENDQPLAYTHTKRLLFNEVGDFMRLLWGSSHVLICSLFRQVLTIVALAGLELRSALHACASGMLGF